MIKRRIPGTSMHKSTLLLLLLLATTGVSGKTLNGFKISDPLIPARLIQRGGPPRDGIPAIDAPRFIPAAGAHHVSDTDRVLGLVVGNKAKAYPIRILNYHEIVNDRFDETPIAVTFCPLCGTGIAFVARIDGSPRHFGVSGLLYNSDVLMYDRETDSLWSQILGKAVNGPAKGKALKPVPVIHTTWADWRQRHPDTLVLAEPRSFRRDYSVDPYPGYADSKRIWFPVAHRDRRYPAKSVIIGAMINGQPYAWPFAELPRDRQTLTDRIAGLEVTIEYDPATHAARVTDARGDEIPSFTAYWFAWVAFHPDTGVWKQSQDGSIRMR